MRSLNQSAIPVFKSWRTAVALTVWSGLAVIALVVWLRRLSGALTDSAGVWNTAAIVLVATLLCSMACLFYLPRQRVCLARSDYMIIGGALALPLALGLALSPQPATAVLWLGVVLIFTAATWFVLIAPGDSRRPALVPSESDRPDFPPRPNREEALSFRVDPDHDLSQWMARTFTADGKEQIAGAVRVQFMPAQKQTAIHLTFSPPFVGRPEVTCEAPGAPDVRLKVAGVYSYGARIDAKRTRATASAESVEVRFSAILTAEAEPHDA